VTELVRLGVDLIVVRGTPAAIAAKDATGTIPVVMASVGEPLPVVDSLARPGRNVTGLSAFVNVMTSKRLELIRELVPTISRIALFANMSNAVAPPQWEETKTAAQSLGIDAELLDVRSLYQRSQILTHHVLPDAGIHASKCESNQRCA
jgi:putative tryptophan/tyrosine transport system substrate-binding protein